MPFYYTIKDKSEEGARTAARLLDLKKLLAEEDIPPRWVDGRLLLATWNIREFESASYGIRRDEPLFYMAEIIDAFDLVAIQEVRDDLSGLNRLMRILGGWWKVILTDVTQGRPGNRERMAFLYDSRKLSFGGLAGQVVLPPKSKKGGGYLAEDQLARTPYIVGFRAGWFKFTICTTHILYGEGVANNPARTREIRRLAEFLADRVSEPYAWAQNMIVLGDFNIFSPNDVTMKALTDAGFVVPPQLQELPSNALKNKHYDQIGFIAPDVADGLEFARAGVLDYFGTVYREEDEKVYRPAMGDAYHVTAKGKTRDAKAKTRYYKMWRTYQMSDHLPMWIELRTDFSTKYLAKKAGIGK